MDIFDMPPRTPFRASTQAQRLEIVSEPYIVATRFGYTPMVTVKALKMPIEYSLTIASKSITSHLEPLRISNSGSLLGLRIELRKESDDARSAYILKPLA